MGNMMPQEIIVYPDVDNKMKLMFMKPNPECWNPYSPAKISAK